ncbi:MAG TPA: hypothetical protein VHE33_09235 [Acidobacteriaceae bacterium]|nr:hypothetical protein [Acidobacteriaceae bacterium]
MIPSLAVVRVENPDWRWGGVRLWLPLVLVYIPLLILSPLILLVVVVACWLGRVRPWRAIAGFWELFCSLAGTDVRVQAEKNRVLVRIL